MAKSLRTTPAGSLLAASRCVEQRASYDCMTACLATIFGCSYEDAPQLADANGDPVPRWHRVMDDWLFARGFACLERMRETDDGEPMRCPWRYPGLWIGGVKSPRYDGDHAVVMHLSLLVWDPHPQRNMGHLGYVDATYFLPLDPAGLAVKESW